MKSLYAAKSTKAMTFSVLAMTLLICCGNAEAGLRKMMGHLPFVPKLQKDTLVITGNYAKPRLLAEIAQIKVKQPILLISEKGGNEQIYYLPASPKAHKVSPDNLADFVEAVVTPARVVVLGDSDYVPTAYATMFKPRYPVIHLAGHDWLKNAEALSQILEYPGLVKVYRQYLGQLLQTRMSGAPGEESTPQVPPESFLQP